MRWRSRTSCRSSSPSSSSPCPPQAARSWPRPRSSSRPVSTRWTTTCSCRARSCRASASPQTSAGLRLPATSPCATSSWPATPRASCRSLTRGGRSSMCSTRRTRPSRRSSRASAASSWRHSKSAPRLPTTSPSSTSATWARRSAWTSPRSATGAVAPKSPARSSPCAIARSIRTTA